MEQRENFFKIIQTQTKNMIDILLATYNGEKFLNEQIDSILSQSCKDWQLLIRDDGSTDATVQIINSYIKQYPDKIKLIEDNLGNLGVGHNFEKLLEHSKSEYIMFCDQDDVWLPEKIKLTLDKMKEAEISHPDIPILIFTDLKVVDENFKIIAESLWSYHKIDPTEGGLFKNMLYRNIVTGCTVMINKKAKEIVLPIPEYVQMHDWWVAMNTAKYGRIFHIPAATVLYRQHSGNVVGTKKITMTFSVFIWKWKRFCRNYSSDYKTIKHIYPSASRTMFFINSLRNSIRRRL
jgi:glycosyltransferase involved in cell wall biosynthesis